MLCALYINRFHIDTRFDMKSNGFINSYSINKRYNISIFQSANSLELWMTAELLTQNRITQIEYMEAPLSSDDYLALFEMSSWIVDTSTETNAFNKDSKSQDDEYNRKRMRLDH